MKTKIFTLLLAIVASIGTMLAASFAGFDANSTSLSGLIQNTVNVTVVETPAENYNHTVNLINGGEGTFTMGGITFSFTNEEAGKIAYKIYNSYIQPNGLDREIRIPTIEGEQVNVILTESCSGMLVNGESVNFVSGNNFITAQGSSIILNNPVEKPKIKAILSAMPPEPREVIIPDGTTLGTWDYEDDLTITSVIIGNKCTIDGWCFYGCKNLQSVIVGDSCKFGGRCFEGIGENVLDGTTVTFGYGNKRKGGGLQFQRGNFSYINVPCGTEEWYEQSWGGDYSFKEPEPIYKCQFLTTQGGSISNNPPLECDSYITEIYATPHYGYHFVQWNDGNTDNPRTIEVTQDTTFAAEFAPNFYSFSATCDANYGSVQAVNGNYEYLTQLTISATPKYGYHFVRWSDDNTSNPRTYTVTGDASIEAIFAPNKYSISALSNPNGEVTGTGTYDYLTECSITAVPHYGYHFTQWNDGNTDNPRTLVLTQDTTFAAFYAVDKSGSCGDDWALTWSYDATIKALTISGEGALNSNYTFGIEAPGNLEKLVIAEGVTSIGQGAFANQTTLQEISLPATVKTVGEQAFYNCTGLTHIYNYRERPAVAYSNTFDGIDKFDCTLHVLSASVDMYKAATGWRDFYYVQTIDAVETTTSTQEVTVEPTDNTATMTWPTNDNAASYTIEITKDGVLFCTLTFNANGQLTGIAFAPSRNGQAHAPAALMTANGLQFTVTGLNSGTQYGYNLTAKDANDQTVATYSGSFTTTSEGDAQGLEDVQSDNVQCTKVLINGQIFIIRGDKTYTTDGQLVR